MTLSLICSEYFPAEWWQRAMPDVSVTSWNGRHATPAAAEDERLTSLRRALTAVAADVDRVSTRTLRQLAGLDSVSPDVYSRLLAKVSADGWRREGRSFARVSPFETA